MTIHYCEFCKHYLCDSCSNKWAARAREALRLYFSGNTKPPICCDATRCHICKTSG